MGVTNGLISGPHAPGMQIEADDGEDFLRVLWCRYRLVLACVALGVVIASAAILLVPPRYSARAVMRVDTDDIDTSNVQSTLSSTRELELRRDHQIETQLQLLSSRPLMRQIVRNLTLYNEPEFNPGGDTYGKPSPAAHVRPKTGAIPPLVIEAVTDRLMNVVKISQDGQTSFLNIDVSSRSPAEAARIANKIASTYVQTQVSEKRASNVRAIQTLDRQVADLRQDLIVIERNAASPYVYEKRNRPQQRARRRLGSVLASWTLTHRHHDASLG